MSARPAEHGDAHEVAEIDAAIAENEAWKAAGRPGGTIPHEAAMAELLGGGLSSGMSQEFHDVIG